MGTLNVPTGSGPKRHRIALQSSTDSVEVDAYGQVIKTWATVGTYWAEINQFRGRMQANAGQQKAERLGQITMRYIGPIDQTTQRFLFGSRILHIVDVNDVGERHREYRIQYHELMGAAAT